MPKICYAEKVFNGERAEMIPVCNQAKPGRSALLPIYCVRILHLRELPKRAINRRPTFKGCEDR
jgi:hypothetical protein